MDFTYILMHFISSFSGALALFWISENLVLPEPRPTLLKKLILASASAVLAVALSPIFAVSLAIGRLIFMLVCMILIKYLVKTKWPNTVLIYTLVITVMMLPSYLVYFAVAIFVDSVVIYSVISYAIAIYLSSKLPIHKMYNFFADRIKPVHAIALIAIVAVVAIYTLTVVWDDGDVQVVVILTIVAACLFFAFYKLAKYLDLFRKMQEVPKNKLGELDELTTAVTDADNVSEDKLGDLNELVTALTEEED